MSTVIDYLANRRWLWLATLITATIGIVVEALNLTADTLIDAGGVELGPLELLLTVAVPVIGQLRANSNRYVAEIEAALAERDEALIEATTGRVFLAEDV